MSKRVKEINGVKIIRRFAPSVMLFGLFSILVLGALAVLCIMPSLRLETSTNTYDINGLNFFQSLISSLLKNTRDEIANNFLKPIYEYVSGTSVNPLINSVLMPAYRYILLGIAGCLLVNAFFGAIAAINGLCTFLSGKAVFPKVSKGFSTISFIFFAIAVGGIYFFKSLYEIYLKQYDATMKLSFPNYLIFILLGASFVVCIALHVIYNHFINGRVHIHNSRKIRKYDE